LVNIKIKKTKSSWSLGNQLRGISTSYSDCVDLISLLIIILGLLILYVNNVE